MLWGEGGKLAKTLGHGGIICLIFYPLEAMGQFMIRRTLYPVVTQFILSLTIFILVRLTGDPASFLAEPGARAEDLDRLRA